MIIRALRAEDYMAWLRLWQGYQQFYQIQIDDDTTGETFRRMLSRAEPVHCLVAEQQGSIIGLAHYFLHRSTWTRGDDCCLHDLYIAEAARGKGAGKALVLAVYKQATLRGCARVYWHTQQNNVVAQALYNQLAIKTDFIQYAHLLSDI